MQHRRRIASILPFRALAFVLAATLAFAQPTVALAYRYPSDRIGEKAAGKNASKLPDLQAPAGILLTMDGRELWSRKPDEARAMASITKIMTAVLVLEKMRGRLDEQVTITEEALAVEESDIRFTKGQTLTVRQALEAVMVHSSNGSAIALAQKVAGGESEFVRMMNHKADALDLKDTVYVNTHGLDEPGHHSTARDIATLARYAMRDPEFRRLAAMKTVTLPTVGGEKEFESTNKLLTTYSGTFGVKTGWTDDAGYSLASAAKRGDTALLAVVLGTPSEESRFQQSARLLDWGFAHYTSRKVASADTTVGTVAVTDYIDVIVPARIDGSSTVPVFDLEGPVKQRVTLDKTVEAPVKAGQRVGTVTVYQGSRMLAQLPAVAAHDVGRPGFFSRLGISLTRGWRSVFGGQKVAQGSVLLEGE